TEGGPYDYLGRGRPPWRPAVTPTRHAITPTLGPPGARRMTARALVVALLVPLAGCGRTKFQEFSPPDGDFTVLLPGSPDRKEQDVAGMKVGVYEVGHRSGTFKVMFADLPLVPPADFLGAAVTGLADQRRGTVVTRSDAGQNGREFEIETADPKGFVSGR